MRLARRWWETQHWNDTYSIPKDHWEQQKKLVMSLKTADGFFKVNNFIVYCLLCVLQGMTFKKLLRDVFFKAQSKHLGAKLSIPVTVSSPELGAWLRGTRWIWDSELSESRECRPDLCSCKNIKVLELELLNGMWKYTLWGGKVLLEKQGILGSFYYTTSSFFKRIKYLSQALIFQDISKLPDLTKKEILQFSHIWKVSLNPL